MTDYDIVVVGTGAAGLCAALTASVGGSRVLIVEKSDLIGGTTAWSGGGTWIPCHPHLRETGAEDSPEEVLRYLRATAPSGWHNAEEPLWVSFVHHAPKMIEFLEAHSPLRFAPSMDPDPYVEAAGGKAFGRMLSPRPVARSLVGPWRNQIRLPMYSPWLNYEEVADTDIALKPVRRMLQLSPKVGYRWLTGKAVMGNALVIGLLRGCLDHGCRLWTESPAMRLHKNGGRITAIDVQHSGRIRTLSLSKGVILACGGFEWNEAMMSQYLPGPIEWTGSPNTNTGDGHRMAEEVGARLDHMDQALIYGTTPARHRDQIRGVPAHDYFLPHCMVVNRHGHRFMNEKAMNMGLAFDERDTLTGRPVHLPAWRIYDANFARKYRHALPKTGLGGVLYRDQTLRGLAVQIAVDPDGLEETARRFSEFAHRGFDEDFARGSTYWDCRRLADPDNHPNPTLGAIERAPFYAYPFKASFLGTKGGPRTNARGAVIDTEESVIQGLFAAGNLMANPFGSKGVGAGSTIGPCLTWGFICGLNAHDLPPFGSMHAGRSAV